MDRTTIYFVRHAHSVYSQDEAGRPLSEKGMKDADYITSLLKQANIDKVISSPYRRAIQTVEGIASHYQLNIEIMDDLKERRLSEFPVPDFQEAMNMVWDNPHYALDGGESNITAQKRGIRAIIHILEQCNGQNIVIGTHGNIMVLMMNFFDSKYDYDFWKTLSMPDIYQLTFEKNKLIFAKRVAKSEEFI